MRTHAWAGGVRPGRQSSLWQCAQYLRQLGLPLPDSGVSGKDKDKDRPAVAVEAEGRCRCTAATQCTRARGLTLRGRLGALECHRERALDGVGDPVCRPQRRVGMHEDVDRAEIGGEGWGGEG